MRALIIGKNGQLATTIQEIAKDFGFEVYTAARPEFNLENPGNFSLFIEEYQPDFIINAAAYTFVDLAEDEVEKANAINVLGPSFISQICQKYEKPIIHISTDYLFDGKKDTPYIETDIAKPLGAYGASKLGGEKAVAANNPNHAIVRVGWLYSFYGRNFVKTMLNLGAKNHHLKIVDDQFGSPTSCHVIAPILLKMGKMLCESDNPELRGIFHLAPQNFASRFEFATKIFDYANEYGGPLVELSPIKSSEYVMKAKRPLNSRLNCNKIKAAYGVIINDWQGPLKECIARIYNKTGEKQ